jgi:hypothetical protein
MGAEKNSSPKRELVLCPKFTTKDSHTSLPRSRSHNGPTNPRNEPQTNLKRKHNPRSKGLGCPAKLKVDGPQPSSGRSVIRNRSTGSAPRTADGLCPVLGRSASNWCHADGLWWPGGQSAQPLATKLWHLGRSMRELARSIRTRQELTPHGQSAGYGQTVRQPSNRTVWGENREVNLPYPTMDLPNGLTPEERFGGDVKRP